MKIVNPTNETHSIELIPRYYNNLANLDLLLINESTNESFEVVNTFSVTDGKLTLTFDFDFLNNDRYSFKLSQENEIVFRGNIFATTQETQDFKQTNNLYYEY